MMSTTELRRSIKKQVDALPADRLQSAADFLVYLEEREDNPAIEALLRIPIEQRLKQAEEDIKAGRLTPAEKLRRKY